MIIFGIDPGVTGAIVTIHTSGDVIGSTMMPVIRSKKGYRIDCPSIRDFINECLSVSKDCHAVLEKVHSMPGQGVSSTFNFGKYYGNVEAVFQTLDIPMSYVTPQTWKKKFGFLGMTKDEPRLLLKGSFPKWKELDVKYKGQALADAYYIAKYIL